MPTRALSRVSPLPSVFDDFFRPFNEIFNSDIMPRVTTVPSVNVTEKDNSFMVALAAPGLTKEDFKIDVEGNMLTISAEKEESQEEKEGERITRKEYNYSSFSRSFTLPETVQQDKIEARYENGVLNLTLPKKEIQNIRATKQIAVQ